MREDDDDARWCTRRFSAVTLDHSFNGVAGVVWSRRRRSRRRRRRRRRARRWDLVVADDEDEQRVAVSTAMLGVHAVHTRRAASLSRRRYRSEGARAGEGVGDAGGRRRRRTQVSRPESEEVRRKTRGASTTLATRVFGLRHRRPRLIRAG